MMTRSRTRAKLTSKREDVNLPARLYVARSGALWCQESVESLLSVIEADVDEETFVGVYELTNVYKAKAKVALEEV